MNAKLMDRSEGTAMSHGKINLLEEDGCTFSSLWEAAEGLVKDSVKCYRIISQPL